MTINARPIHRLALKHNAAIVKVNQSSRRFIASIVSGPHADRFGHDKWRRNDPRRKSSLIVRDRIIDKLGACHGPRTVSQLLNFGKP